MDHLANILGQKNNKYVINLTLLQMNTTTTKLPNTYFIIQYTETFYIYTKKYNKPLNSPPTRGEAIHMDGRSLDPP